MCQHKNYFLNNYIMKAVQRKDGRFVLIEGNTIIDDNQGYGFENPNKAYKCFYWKKKNK